MQPLSEILQNLLREQRRVLVFGAGKTGVSLSHALLRLGAKVTLWDERPRSELNEFQKKKFEELKLKGLQTSFGGEAKVVGDDFALLIPSPGIPISSPLFQVPRVFSLTQVSELELGLQLFSEIPNAKQIVVTGSNGKSTTVALIHHILSSLGKKSVLCGNIGTPIFDVLPENPFAKTLPDTPLYLVVEASSYQLENFKFHAPDVAVILNLTENHLDRHGSMENYFRAKKNLLRSFRPHHTLITCAYDPWSRRFEEGVPGLHRRFGEDDNSELILNFEEMTIRKQGAASPLLKQSDCLLIGRHNLGNVAAALLACMAVGSDPHEAAKSVANFSGLEHRLERIPLSGGAIAYNDSKATTVQASVAACNAVIASNSTSPIVLMLGGQEKEGSDWQPLIELCRSQSSRFQALVLFGECRDKLSALFGRIEVKLELCDDFSEAVHRSKDLLKSGSVLLHSPACASFDEFDNFEQRGEEFKRLLQA